MVTGESVAGVTAYGPWAEPEGEPNNMDLEFEITWRQAPTMSRVRRKKYRVRLVDTNLFAYELMDFRGWLSSTAEWIIFPLRRMRGWP